MARSALKERVSNHAKGLSLAKAPSLLRSSYIPARPDLNAGQAYDAVASPPVPDVSLPDNPP